MQDNGGQSGIVENSAFQCMTIKDNGGQSGIVQDSALQCRTIKDNGGQSGIVQDSALQCKNLIFSRIYSNKRFVVKIFPSPGKTLFKSAEKILKVIYSAAQRCEAESQSLRVLTELVQPVERFYCKRPSNVWRLPKY